MRKSHGLSYLNYLLPQRDRKGKESRGVRLLLVALDKRTYRLDL